jgi:exopolysaccharide biosynthesis predicted pyruvyltransferase EpsI
MHPALRKQYTIKNDIIWFEHKKQLVKDFGNDSIPRYINSGSNIDHTIELLGSANIIITNSYHGAYWGTLLKKRVIVVSPWSSKFFALRHQVPLIDKTDNWTDAIDRCEIYQDALDECESETINMWTKVQSL